jgi:hypothetical protein
LYFLIDINGLSNFLQSTAESVGIPLEENFINQMHDKNIGGKIYAHMRALFHLSVSISPLYMTFPNSFSNAAIGREQMMSVSRNDHNYVIFLTFLQISIGLGNMRPDAVARAERALWQSVIAVATGSTGFDELSKFFHEFQHIQSGMADNERDLDWFSMDRK